MFVYYLVTVLSGVLCGVVLGGVQRLRVAFAIDGAIVLITSFVLFGLEYDAREDILPWLAFLASTSVVTTIVTIAKDSKKKRKAKK